jgi:RNA polymerase sigma-70 factor (ECF subfamily)
MARRSGHFVEHQDDTAIKQWFASEVLPLEPSLMRYLRRNWRNEGDIADLRQEVYLKLYASARNGEIILNTKAFVFTVARNHLINCVKRSKIISIEHVADLEASIVLADNITPDRTLLARDEVRRLHAGLSNLPPRCQQVVRLRKIEGLTTREVADKLKVSLDTVEQQMVHGMRALVDFMLGGSGKIKRPVKKTGRSAKR